MSSILIADDDKTCRDSIQKVLEKEGYTVRTAEDVDGLWVKSGSLHLTSSSATTECPARLGWTSCWS
jgi:CheY-like chemotaxis protein